MNHGEEAAVGKVGGIELQRFEIEFTLLIDGVVALEAIEVEKLVYQLGKFSRLSGTSRQSNPNTDGEEERG